MAHSQVEIELSHKFNNVEEVKSMNPNDDPSTQDETDTMLIGHDDIDEHANEYEQNLNSKDKVYNVNNSDIAINNRSLYCWLISLSIAMLYCFCVATYLLLNTSDCTCNNMTATQAEIITDPDVPIPTLKPASNPTVSICCNCTERQTNAGCTTDLLCETEICINQKQSFCCNNQWDRICANAAQEIAGICPTPITYPTMGPTRNPSTDPTTTPIAPTFNPTENSTGPPSLRPTNGPTNTPFSNPIPDPTEYPTINPTIFPTAGPSINPTKDPTPGTTSQATVNPTLGPTSPPTINPSSDPTIPPTSDPTNEPTTDSPSMDPSVYPTIEPTILPTLSPTYDIPYFDKSYFIPERLVYLFSHGHDISESDDPYGPLLGCGIGNSTCHSPIYYHIITPLTHNSDLMYRFTVRGYAYGIASALDLLYLGYTFADDHIKIERPVLFDLHNSAGNMEQYIGSNGTVVLKFGPIARYFNGFALYYQGYLEGAEIGLQFDQYVTKGTIDDVRL